VRAARASEQAVFRATAHVIPHGFVKPWRGDGSAARDRPLGWIAREEDCFAPLHCLKGAHEATPSRSRGVVSSAGRGADAGVVVSAGGGAWCG